MSFITSMFRGVIPEEKKPFITNQEIRSAILKIQDAFDDSKGNHVDKRDDYILKLHDYAQTLIDAACAAPKDKDAEHFKDELERYQIDLFDFRVCGNDKRAFPSFPRFYSRGSGFSS